MAAAKQITATEPAAVWREQLPGAGAMASISSQQHRRPNQLLWHGASGAQQAAAASLAEWQAAAGRQHKAHSNKAGGVDCYLCAGMLAPSGSSPTNGVTSGWQCGGQGQHMWLLWSGKLPKQCERAESSGLWAAGSRATAAVAVDSHLSCQLCGRDEECGQRLLWSWSAAGADARQRLLFRPITGRHPHVCK